MYKIIFLAVSVTVISGCASLNKQVIDVTTVTSLRNQTITYTTRMKPDFMAVTTGKAVIAIFTGGGSDMIREGNSIIEKNSIPDPADAIAIGLAKAIAISYGSRLNASPISVNSDDPIKIADMVKGAAKFVVDVQTTKWYIGATGNSLTSSRYGVNYSAKARLIDAETKTVVAKGFCERFPDNANAPTYDELLANEASLLKKQLASAADECVKSIKVEMLSL